MHGEFLVCVPVFSKMAVRGVRKWTVVLRERDCGTEVPRGLRPTLLGVAEGGLDVHSRGAASGD